MSAVAPAGQKLPTVHAAHDVAPAAAAYVPAAHTAHVALETADVAAENVPAGQLTAAAEPTGQYEPAVHATPAVAPTAAQNWPAGHGLSVADVLPVPTQKPAAHAPEHVAAVRLAMLPNVPAGHGVGNPAPARQ